jgi:hypothetical protein
VEFFSEFLMGSSGEAFPFVTEQGPWSLDTGRMPEDLKPRVEMMGDGSRRYRVDAYIAEAAAMFAVSLEIEPNGVVDMIEDEPLGRFVPLQ